VQRLVTRGKAQRARTPAVTQAFVPLAFPPGETGQFDWSQEEVELGGVVQTIQVAHVRLSDSRQMCVVASPRETPERVFEAPIRAFACFGGAPQRVVDDHLRREWTRS
jgi:transposase